MIEDEPRGHVAKAQMTMALACLERIAETLGRHTSHTAENPLDQDLADAISDGNATLERMALLGEGATLHELSMNREPLD